MSPVRSPGRRSRWAHRRFHRSRHGRRRDGPPLVALVGQPNVGKSQLFNRLTGARVTVSNYPGTTVEVARSRLHLPQPYRDLAIVDTPGMYSLSPLTEEERVARNILLDERPHLIVHIVDAKNLPRMLALTLELLEAGLPVLLAVNMMDEARQLGLRLDLSALENRLDLPVFATVGTTGEGVESLRAAIIAHVYPDHRLHPTV